MVTLNQAGHGFARLPWKTFNVRRIWFYEIAFDYADSHAIEMNYRLECFIQSRQHFRHFKMSADCLGDLKNDLSVGFSCLRESRTHVRRLPMIEEKLQPID